MVAGERNKMLVAAPVVTDEFESHKTPHFKIPTL